jgi:hypothetical protein
MPSLEIPPKSKGFAEIVLSIVVGLFLPPTQRFTFTIIPGWLGL